MLLDFFQKNTCEKFGKGCLPLFYMGCSFVKKIYGYIFGAVLLLALAAGGILGALSSSSLQQKAGEITSDTVKDVIGLQTEIGTVRAESFNNISINDIVVYDNDGEVMLKAPKIDISFALLSAVTDINSAVKEITVNSPTAYLKVRESGEVNLSDIKMESEGESAFKSKISVENGTVFGKYEGTELKLENVNAKVDIDGDDINYDGSLTNFDGNIKIGGYHGKYDDISLKFENFDVKNYKDIFKLLHTKEILPEFVKIIGGKLPNLSLNIERNGEDVSLRGKGEITDGIASVYDTVIDNINGNVAFSDKKIIIDAEAASNNQAANIAGTVDFSDTPTMDLAAKSDSFDLNEVFAKIPLKGAIALDAKITGTFDNPVVAANITQESGEINDIILKNTSVKARMIGKKLYVDEGKTNIFDGELFASGELDTSDLSYILHAKGEKLRLEYASNFASGLSGLFGDASLDVNVHGKGDDLNALKIYGHIKGNDLHYQNVDLDNIRGSFYGNGGDITVDYLSANLANKGGSIGLEGKIFPNSFADLSLYAQAIEFEAVHNLVPTFIGTGRGDITAKVSGSIDNPNFNCRVSSVFGSLFNEKYDSMRAVLSGSLERINIDEFIFLKDGKNYWQASGYFGVAGEKILNLDVITDGARLEHIVNLFVKDAELTGNLKNTTHIGGTLDSPAVSGRARLNRGSVKGMLIQSLEIAYAFNNDILNVESADLTMPLLDASIKGTLNVKTEAMNFDIAANDIDMERLQHKFPYKVSGHGTFNGKVHGTITNPEAVAVANAESLTFNGETIENVNIAANFKNNALNIQNLDADIGEGKITVNALADFKNDLVGIGASVDNVEIESLLHIANSESKHLKGKLTAKALTNGSLKEPQTKITGVIKTGTLAGYPIKDVELSMKMNRLLFEVESFKGFEGENGEINGSLVIKPKVGLSGNVTGKNIDFGLFTALAGVNAKVIGKADIESSFRGNFKNPAADITLTVTKGGIEGSTFDTLTGNLSLDTGNLFVKDLVVQKDVGKKHYMASMKGRVPIKAAIDDAERSAKWEENPENSMDLTLHLDDANLSLIPALSKAVEWAEGETDGEIKLTGSLKRPELHGNLKVENGALKLKALRKPITNINLNLVGKGREITLENFSGNLGSGNYKASGNAALTDNDDVTYNFDLELNALQIDSVYYTGPLSGKLNLTQGVWGRGEKRRVVPKISGSISSEYAQIVVPVIPESETPTPEILLDLYLNFGKRVHLYEPQLYDMYFSGSAHFGGSTLMPFSSGTIEVHRGGAIKVSHNTFRINAGEITFNQPGTFLPSVKFFADTHVGKTKIYVALMGPLGTDKIKPYLTSSPAMSQTEIIRLLTLGTDYQKDSNGTDEVRGILIAGLHMTALAGIERELKRGLSLDAFSLAYGSGSTFPRHREKDDYYSISTGKYISDKWLLRYNQGLGTGTGNYLIGLTYEINDRTGVILEHVDGANIVGLEAKIRF